MSNPLEQPDSRSEHKPPQTAHAELLDSALGTPGSSPPGMIEKAVVFGKAAAGAIPEGAWQSLTAVDHLTVPFSKTIAGKDLTVPVPKVLENAAIGTAIGFASRTLLPETGILSKVGVAALGTVFAAPLAGEGLKIANEVWYAKNTQELTLAGKELGTALGGLAAGLPIGMLSYNFGASLSDRMLATETMAPFARGKQDFYNALNQKVSTGIDATTDALKNALTGKPEYTGSHKMAEQFERIPPALSEQLKGPDYRLPEIHLESDRGKGINVLVVTGNGADAAEYTGVTNALKEAGADVRVATPDWMWQYQLPKGEFSLAQGMENSRVARADLSVSESLALLKKGDFDAVYVPGGAANAAALRTDPGTLELLKTARLRTDVWSTGNGGQVIASAEAFPKGTILTGSPDITPMDLPKAGFTVPKGPVAYDETSRVLSAQGADALNPFISEIGKRFDAIRWMGWIRFSML
jgi:putative intracellular protease/amidase